MRKPRPAPSRRPAAPAPRGAWAWAATGALLGALGALLLWAPARWLEPAATAASEGRLRLGAPQGTLWQGSAQLTLAGGAGSSDAARLPGRVHWELRPALDGLHIALRADCCMAQAQQLALQPGLRGWGLQVAASDSRWPAALLAGLGTPWNTVQLQGSMRLSSPGLRLESSLGRLSVQGSARLELPALSTRLSTLRPLGSYALELQGGEQPSLELRSLAGSPLQLQGHGEWNAGRLRFVGEARAAAAHEAELANLLNIMGRRDGARSVITLG